MRAVRSTPFVVVGIVLTLALAWFVWRSAPPASAPPTSETPLVLQDGDDALHTVMEGIYAADRGVTPPTGYAIRGVIVPHHLTASATLASGIRMLSRQDVRGIILLSPDHFDGCPTLLCTGEVRFRTLFGDIEGSPTVRDILTASSLVTDQPELFAGEHGIRAVVPYIAHYLPGVSVTPVVVSQRLPWSAQKDALRDLLYRATGAGMVLAVSSDFSHYLPLDEADAMDELTAQALFAKDLDGIASLAPPDQTDCPACLWALASVADAGRFYNPSVVAHSNSARIIGETDLPETTSHFAMVWYTDSPLNGDDLAVAGDVTVTRGVPRGPSDEVAAWWAGNGPRIVNLEGPIARTCPSRDNPYLFCNASDDWSSVRDLASHWVVVNNHMFDLGDEGFAGTARLVREAGKIPVTADGADAGEWRVFAVTETVNPVDGAAYARIAEEDEEVLATVRAADARVPTLVYVHGGAEYAVLASAENTARWERFIDAGADAVVVAHSHVPGDVVIYKERPIFRGLGNFMFDQYASVSTSTARTVRLRSAGDRVLFETLLSSVHASSQGTRATGYPDDADADPD